MQEITKNYYKIKRLSNSFLSLIQNPVLFKMKLDGQEPPFENKDFFRIGSAIDCKLTAPETFDSEFQIINANKPFGLLGKFIDALPLGLNVSSPIQLYQDAHALAEYKISIDRAVRTLWSNAEAIKYYEALHNTASGKTILTLEDYEIVEQCVNSILNNPYTRDYFVPKDEEELLFQVPVLFEYRDLEFKALLDGIRINHKDKTITPFDLKSTGFSVFNFGNSFINFGYHRQAALYYYAVQTKESPVRHLLDEGYTQMPFRFIVTETRKNTTAPALVWEVASEDLAAGFFGGVANGRAVKGIDQLIDDYNWHLANDLWEFPREVYEKEGVFSLSVFEHEKSEFELVLSDPDAESQADGNTERI